MKKSKYKVTARWSKKEKDWLFSYNVDEANGRSMSKTLHTMIQQFDELMSRSWDGKPTGYKNFRQHLIDGGFDPNTFTMSVHEKIKEETKNT